MRSFRDCAENFAKTTECTAPNFEEVSITYAASGVMGIYKVIHSPFFATVDLIKARHAMDIVLGSDDRDGVAARLVQEPKVAVTADGGYS